MMMQIDVGHFKRCGGGGGGERERDSMQIDQSQVFGLAE
jgi:hypothetical protein